MHLAAVLVVAIAFPAGAATFNGLDLNLVGSATIPASGINAGNLLLTPSTDAAVGAAWLNSPLSTASPFTTRFSFKLNNVGGIGNADGIALIFQNLGTSALGSSGGNLGIDLPDNTTSNGAVAAVFQTFWQSYGIVQNTDANGGPFSASLPVNAPDDISTADLIIGTETVSYNPTTLKLSQTISFNYTIGSTTTPVNLSTEASFDLGARFGGTMTVGIGAATGAGSTDQSVTAWSVASVPEPGSWMTLAAGLIACAGIARRSSRA